MDLEADPEMEGLETDQEVTDLSIGLIIAGITAREVVVAGLETDSERKISIARDI